MEEERGRKSELGIHVYIAGRFREHGWVGDSGIFHRNEPLYPLARNALDNSPVREERGSEGGGELVCTFYLNGNCKRGSKSPHVYTHMEHVFAYSEVKLLLS